MAKKHKRQCRNRKLTVDELLKTETLLCKHIQKKRFSEEYYKLTKGKHYIEEKETNAAQSLLRWR